ncbi:hypothetical protein [Anditalea andensis]|uniref:BioF2-like acetyltransferase domain-containing protein n=1 Tax=Anditalea andensis TaxID=1048983 RepID=A0A074LM93_9BACT|nr:hypothetical protein [Anditalea andensis]KEO75002.1 hypothetical protein EL17_04830 [Anditalea andensis]
MKQSMISLNESSKWNHALTHVPHAFGHTWESCYAMSLSTGLDTYLYHFEDDGVHIVCPLSERTYEGFVDVFTPYGFSGFTGNSGYAEFPGIWEKFANGQQYICGYISMNPFLKDSASGYAFLNSPANDLYALNLNLSIDQLFANLSTNRKRQVKKYAEIKDTFSQDKSILKTFFIEHFHDFFKDRDAALFSSFTKDTLSHLVNLDNVLLVGKIADGKVEAVSVFAYTAYIAEYLFNISIPEGRSHTVLLLWEGIHVLKGIGVPILNLGGGIKKGDSLSDFKERFGAIKYQHTVLKQVYNKQIYMELCQRREVEDTDHYFPAYRKRKSK